MTSGQNVESPGCDSWGCKSACIERSTIRSIMRQNPRRSPFRPLYAFGAAGSLLLIAMLCIPVLDGPHSRRYANEASAVSKLRAITMLGKKFAAAHPEQVFAC